MTDDDICGYEGTHDETPCENPPSGDNGRCHIRTHNAAADGGDPENVENRAGPPEKLPEVRDDILQAAREGASKNGCARAAGIHKSTFYEWINPDSDHYHEEFHREFLQARWQGERRFIENADDVDARHAQFMLERSFGYTKTETVEHEGDALGDVVVSFSEDDTDDE